MYLDYNKFFKNVEYILNRRPKQRTNVLVLNTACNMACEYCYEQTGRNKLENHKTLSTKEIDEAINEIMIRENGQISTLVIYGGEAFLEVFCVKYVKRKLTESNHSWGVELITNGTLLKKISKEKLQYICKNTKNVYVELVVSYDGSGQFRRIFKNGNPSDGTVKNNMKYLQDLKIPFGISYTVHRGNCQNLLRDVVIIMEKWKPTKIELSIGWKDLEDAGFDGHEIKNQFQPYAIELFKRYKIPICDLSCPVCKKCDKRCFEGNTYFTPYKGIQYKNKLEKEESTLI